jgi:phage terminase small subunit
MSGPLKNPRHEAFIQHLLQGKNATDAYAAAGFMPDGNGANASRLNRNPKVAARLAELQAGIAAETVVTVKGLINELEDARKRATDLKQLSAAIKAIEAKAKLSGLVVDKQQIEIGGPGSFDGMDDQKAICLKVADDLLKYEIEPYHDFRDSDRQRLADMWQECFDTFSLNSKKLIEEIHGRPLKASFKPPKALPHLNGKSRQGAKSAQRYSSGSSK